MSLDVIPIDPRERALAELLDALADELVPVLLRATSDEEPEP